MVLDLPLLLGLSILTWASGIIVYKGSQQLERQANYLLGEGKKKIVLKFLEEGIEFISESQLSELLEEILIANKIKDIEFENIQKQVIDRAKIMTDEIGKMYSLSKLMIKIDNVAHKFSIFSRQLKVITFILFLLPEVVLLINSMINSFIVDFVECLIGTNLLALSYLTLINWVLTKFQIKKNYKELEI